MDESSIHSLVFQLNSLAKHVLKSQKATSNSNTAETLQNAIVEVLVSQVKNIEGCLLELKHLVSSFSSFFGENKSKTEEEYEIGKILYLKFLASLLNFIFNFKDLNETLIQKIQISIPIVQITEISWKVLQSKHKSIIDGPLITPVQRSATLILSLLSSFPSYYLSSQLFQSISNEIIRKCAIEFCSWLKKMKKIDTSVHSEEEGISFAVIALLTSNIIHQLLLQKDQENNKQFYEDIFDTCVKLMMSEENANRKIIISSLLPSFFSEQFSTLLTEEKKTAKLQILWKKANDMINSGDDSLIFKDAFDFLCKFYEIFFPRDESKIHLDLRSDERFWQILQRGMLHVDTLVRKRSSYLLKRIIATTDAICKLHSSNYSNSLNYFHWNFKRANDLQKYWSTFFLVFETLEEFNLHLIKPVWPQMEIIHKMSIYLTLDQSWMNILYRKGLFHENPTSRKWMTMNLLQNEKNVVFEELFVLEHLTPSLSFLELYKGVTASAVKHLIPSFYQRYYSLLSDERKTHFLKNLLIVLMTVNLHRFAISSILQFIANLKQDLSIIDSTVIEKMCFFLETRVIYMFYVHRTKTCHLLCQILVNLSNYQSLSYSDVTSIIRSFPTIELSYQSDNWRNISQWISKIEEKQKPTRCKEGWSFFHIQESISNYLKQASVDSNITFYDLEKYIEESMLLVRMFCFIKDYNQLGELFAPFFQDVFKIYSSYMKRGHPEKLLALLSSLFAERNNLSDEIKKIIPSFLKDNVEEIVSYIQEKLNSQMQKAQTNTSSQTNVMEHSWDITSNQIYTLALCECLLHSRSTSVNEFKYSLISSLIQFLENTKPQGTPFQESFKYSCMIFISEVGKFIGEDDKITEEERKQINRCVNAIMQSNLHIPLFSGASAEDAWRKYNNSFLTIKWNSLQQFLQKLATTTNKDSNFNIDNYVSIFERCSNEYEVASMEYIVPLLECTRIVLVPFLSIPSSTLSQDEIKKKITFLLGSAWKSSTEKKNINAVCSFIRMAFQPVMLKSSFLSEGEKSPLKKQFANVMNMSTIMFAIANSLAFYLHQVFKQASNLYATKLWTKEIIELALFGPDRKGQLQEGEALEYDIEVHSYKNNSNYLFTTHSIPQNDLYVRVLIYSLISDLSLKAKEDKEIKSFVFDTLLIQFLSSNLSESQKKYRAWTPHHQKEIRYWQTLCAFIPFIDELEASHVTSINNFIWEIIDVLHHRTVRQYIELFVIHFLIKNKQLVESHLIKLLKRVNERSDICYTALVIAGFTVMFLDLNESENRLLFKRVMRDTVGHALSNHGTIRKGAQSVIVKVFEHVKSKSSVKNKDELLDSLVPLYEYIQTNDECMKMLSTKSSIFQHFHNLGGITTELIFFKLTQEDAFPLSEQITPEIFMQLLHNDSSASVSTASIQSNDRDDDSPKSEKEISHTEENFQKKILPWESFVQTTLSDSLEYEETIFRESVLTYKPRSEIIVVATLIDKIPNLAGLARTCEIFNATALVLANKKVEATPQFADISVTAEKWLPILEVPEYELAQFLEEKKIEGWTLLGVEQTANSASLVDFEFPKKSVLLLGKEKEGIPVEYIQMLDKCIEIPQLGIIRSLNVHVSGSIMLWEYTQQQLRKK